MDRCQRCGGSYVYDAIDAEWRCLLCARPRDPAPLPLPLVPKRKPRARHAAPIGPTPAPPGYLRMDEIARTYGLTPQSVSWRIRARGVPYRRGKRRVIFVAEADVPTLALDVKAWRRRPG